MHKNKGKRISDLKNQDFIVKKVYEGTKAVHGGE